MHVLSGGHCGWCIIEQFAALFAGPVYRIRNVTDGIAELIQDDSSLSSNVVLRYIQASLIVTISRDVWFWGRFSLCKAKDSVNFVDSGHFG